MKQRCLNVIKVTQLIVAEQGFNIFCLWGVESIVPALEASWQELPG